MTHKATAVAYSNIAFIKYWGNRNNELRIPATGSLSMNLDGIQTETTVEFKEVYERDVLYFGETPADDTTLRRVSAHLDVIREDAGCDLYAKVVTQNNFPMGTGIASSASAFAALTLSAYGALDLTRTESQLSAMARRGSGSASRSIPGGFVEWHRGSDHKSSYAETFAAPNHWDLTDLIIIVSDTHKGTGSTGGHRVAPTSPLQSARIADTKRRLTTCKNAILQRDFDIFAEIIELDTLMMHAVMMTSEPSLLYWHPPTLQIIQTVRELRATGYPVAFTIDAGPNVHVITDGQYTDNVSEILGQLEGIKDILVASAGDSAHLTPEHLF